MTAGLASPGSVHRWSPTKQIHTTAEEMNHTLVKPRMTRINSKGSLHRLKHQKELLWKKSVDKCSKTCGRNSLHCVTGVFSVWNQNDQKNLQLSVLQKLFLITCIHLTSELSAQSPNVQTLVFTDCSWLECCSSEKLCCDTVGLLIPHQ